MTSVIGTTLSTTSYSAATAAIMSWARAGENRYVCVATVQTLMEAHDSAEFSEVIRGADMVTPDGMPLVWMLRMKGHREQTRVYGPTLMLRLLEAAEAERILVGLLGGTPEALLRLRERLGMQFPHLEVAYAASPPFRELSPAEDDEIVRQILNSGTRVLFVGLGCPKQERWMAAHRNKIPAVMIGVGAAFDFLSGSKAQAPAWMQSIGLEWLFRLLHEPRRLWRRYLYHNPRFAALALAELLGVWSP
jgi:N-acetylglucosaminyldiphosphoundecaprenol N-acetyl-beta-D-mannosaminyltransferase